MSLIQQHSYVHPKTRHRSIVTVVLTVLLASFMLITAQLPAKAVGTFSNAVIADYAVNNFAVGSQQGQCRTFVNNVVMRATGLNTGTGWPDYFVGFTNAGAQRITDVNALAKGDIVQYGQTEAYAGLHTFIIVGKVSGSTYDVIDSNSARDGKVARYNRQVMLDNDRRAFRLGTVTGGEKASQWGGVGNATFIGTDRLGSGQTLYQNQYLLSGDGRFVLMLQTDGNVVIYTSSGFLWHANSGGKSGTRLVMQADGNLVLYNGSGGAVWHTGTGGKGASTFVIQNDGNGVIYPNGSASWQTGTGGRGVASSSTDTDRLGADAQLTSGRY